MEDNTNKKLEALINHALYTNERLEGIEKILEKQELNLAAHMARTALNEEAVKIAKEDQKMLKEEHKQLTEDIKPMLQHFQGAKWALQALAVVTAVMGALQYFK